MQHPNLRFRVSVLVLTAGAIAGSATVLILGIENAGAYVLYALTAIFAAYEIYSLIQILPRIKALWIELTRKYGFTRRFASDYAYRTLVFATVSLAINIGYALFQGAMAILSRSVWLGSLSAYYLLLSVLRGSIITNEYRHRRDEAKATALRKLKTYRACGAGLILLDVAMCASVTQMMLSTQTVRYEGLLVYAAATYTFYKATMAGINLVKAAKSRDPISQSLRNINLADALVSLVGLETAMIAAFGSMGELKVLSAVVGFAVCASTVAIGIGMSIRAGARLRRLRSEEVKTDKEPTVRSTTEK